MAREKKLSAGDISLFCTQIAMVLKAGIPLHEGVNAMLGDMNDSPMKRMLTDLDSRLQNNAPLGTAMEETKMFPDYLVKMVSIGDLSGRLDGVLEKMAIYYDRDRIMKEKIRGAIMYPTTLFIMMSVIVVLLVTQVLPMFEKIFNQIGGHISTQANTALTFGMTAGAIALGVIMVCLLGALLTLIVSKTKAGKIFMNTLYMKLPGLRGMMSKMAARNFASAMSMMLYSGVDVDKGLEMSSTVLNNAYMAKKLDACRAKVREGVPFTDAIASAGLFPGLFSRMVSIGFKTGSTSEVMDKLSRIYEDEIETSLDNATALIEPILVGILALIIGIILVAVMLPLAGIMTSIG